jgi:hypothetical protein
MNRLRTLLAVDLGGPSSSASPEGTSVGWAARLPLAVILAASYGFRIPPLVNARATNSDAAVVGLQAMHILEGELSPLLWGSGYQTSADAFVAAAFFMVLGSTPLALMLSSLTLHVVATWLVFATLRRHFAPWTATMLVMPLVVSPSSVHSYALYPPRQLALTLALAAFFFVDGAGRDDARASIRRRERWLFVGGLLATAAVSADPYALLSLPLVCLFAALVVDPPLARPRGWIAFGAGLAIGITPFMWIRQLPNANGGPLGMTSETIRHNWRLLVDECLPWALSYKVYFARTMMDYRPWEVPEPYRVFSLGSAIALGALVAIGLGAAPYKRLPWSIRRIGVVGALAFPLAIAAFLVSVMVMDHFSMRYLAVLTLMTPFAAATACRLLGPRRFGIVFAPHLVASAVCGWVGYGPFVRGPLPVGELPSLKDDGALVDALRARGVTHALADYWASYRLTFVSRRQLIVVPMNAAQDRYEPYRRALEAEDAFAYVYDPERSQEDPAASEEDLRARFASVERLAVGKFTILLVRRGRSSP